MASQTITPAERIRELSAINAEVAGMLQSAGHAINALTNRPLQSSSTTEDADDDTDMNDHTDKTAMDERKDVFAHHTEAYYTALQSIVARLRRQAYALEEAGIIAPEAAFASTTSASAAPKPAAPGAGRPQPGVPSQPPPASGNLDVGWLNSRGNRVGAEKDAELIEEAKELLESVLARDGIDVNGE